MAKEKTHYRKAFKSPYLSSADIVEPTVLTIARVDLVLDETKKTKDHFNTAYFVENEIRKGEVLKPMILNAGNSRIMSELTGSKFIDDWQDVTITIYVDQNVKFGRDTVEGLRIREASCITEAQYNTLHAMLTDNGLDKDEKYIASMCKYLKIDSLGSLAALPVKDFTKANTAIKAAAKSRGEQS